MADSWFSYLQIQICKSFEALEDNKIFFSKRHWYKKNVKEGGGTSYLYLVEKSLIKLVSINQLYQEYFLKNLGLKF